MLKLDNKPLSYDRAFTHADIQYPANWLRLSSLEERNAIGVVEVADAPSYDQRFYWGVDNPKDIDQLKEQWTGQVKSTAGSMLAQSDWYIVRRSDNGVEVPEEVTARRVEIRAFSEVKEGVIASCETVDELAAYLTSQEFHAWEPLPEPEPEPDPEPIIELPVEDDTIVFSGESTSGQINTDVLSL